MSDIDRIEAAADREINRLTLDLNEARELLGLYKEFSGLQTELLVCYRIQKRPSEKTLDGIIATKSKIAKIEGNPEGSINQQNQGS